MTKENKRRGGCLGCILGFLLAIIFIVVMLTVFLLGATPAQIGLSNLAFNGHTLQQLGVSDVKFNQMLTLAKSLTTEHQQSVIAPDSYTDVHKQSANDKFAGTRIDKNGEIHYKQLLYYSAQTALSPTSQPIVLGYGEIAYVIDSALHQFYVSTEKDLIDELGVEAVDVLQSLDASVVQTSLSSTDSQIFLTTTLRLNIADYVAEINQQLPFGIRIADILYCTLTNKIVVDDNGNITDTGFVSVAINDQDKELSKTALDALFMIISEEGSEPLTSQQISQYVCIVVKILCSHIGSIGTKTDVLHSVYGANGIDFAAQTVTFLPSKTIQL